MPDASARIWAILGGLLLMAVMVVALRWTFGTDRQVPTARLADPDDPDAFGLLEEVSRVPGARRGGGAAGPARRRGHPRHAEPRRARLPDPGVPGRPEGRPGRAQQGRSRLELTPRWYLASKKQNTP